MSFFGKILKATGKAIVTPLAILKDSADIISGEEGGTTSKLIDSIKNDVDDAFDELTN